MTDKERKVQSQIMSIVRKYGGYVYKNAQNIYTEKGRPDLSACVPTTLKALKETFGENAKVGIFLGIEVKRDKKTYDASDAQIIVGKEIKKANGIWLSIDDPMLIEALMLKFTKYNSEEENDDKQ